MSGAGGKWMVSSVTEAQVKRLMKAGYLSKDIPHRLPNKGQLLPTPRPHERVVFLPHFLRTGLSTSPICPGAHVLLRPGFPRSGPELRSQHLGVYRRV